MAKKRHKTRRSQSKGHHLFRIFLQSKRLWAIFSLLLSLLLIIGSTYAWITYSDERVNQTQMTTKELSLVIDETYIPDWQWYPGKVTEKKVTVRNNGQIPAVARMSLYEFLLQFEIDVRDGEALGNGGLKRVKVASNQLIDSDKVSTWQVGNTYKVSNETFLVAHKVFLSDTQDVLTAYKYKEASVVEGLTYLTIQFNEPAIFEATNLPETTSHHYWYYEAGYFYYSEVLQPGEQTVPLLTSISLAKTLPNEYKGSLYQLVPVMDGHDISKRLLEDWQLTGFVASIYDGKIH